MLKDLIIEIESGILADQIFSAMREPMLVLDSSLNVISANHAFYYTFKATKEETVGKQFYQVNNGLWDIPELKDALKKVLMRNEEFSELEVKRIFPGEGERVLRLSCKSVLEGNKVNLILLDIQDVTEHRKKEQAIDNARLYAESIITTISEQLLVLDSHLNVVSANTAFYETFKTTKENTLGKPICEVANGICNIPELKMALEKIIPNHKQIENFILEQPFSQVDERIFFVNASIIVQAGDISNLILIAFQDITALKKAEHETHKREEELRTIINNSTDLIARFDREARFLFLSPWIETITGQNVDFFIGRAIDDFAVYSEASIYKMKNTIQKVIETKASYAVEGEFTVLGKRVYWEVKFIPEIKGNEVQTVLSIGRDITERIEKEHRLQEAEERYRIMFEGGYPTLLVDLENKKFIDCNTKFIEAIGYTKKELRYLSFQNILTRHLNNVIPDEFQFLDQKKELQFEWELYNREGKAINLYFCARFVKFCGKQYLLCMFQDITQIKKIQKELEQIKENYRKLSDNSPDGIIRYDKKLRILYINPALTKITGKSQDFYLNRPVYETLDNKENVDMIIHSIKEVFQTKKAVEKDFIVGQPPDDQYFHTIFMPEFDKNGEVETIFNVGHDITSIIKAEKKLQQDKVTLEKLIAERTEALIQTYKKLENAQRLADIGTLASTVAHELRSPLAGIRAANYNIKKKCENVEKHTSTIDKKIDDSNQIIDNLLFYSRIRDPHYQTIKLDNLLTEAVEYIRKKAKKPQINVITDYAGLSNLVISCDPLQLKEVLHNLLNNAYDSIASADALAVTDITGRPEKGNIEILGLEKEESIEITIKDNGIGIDKEDIPKVFDPFFSTKAKGTGLGLPVSKQIIENHKGNLVIESITGKGTTVTIILPKRI